MLSKVKTTKITKEEVLYENAAGGYSQGYTEQAIFSPFTINQTATVSVHFTTSMSNGYGNVKLYKDSTVVQNISQTGTYDFNVPFTAGQTTKITCQYSSSASQVTRCQNIKYSIKAWEITPKSVAPATPKEVKAIGEMAILFLYGLDTNGNYKGGIVTATSNTATTGSVTLGNAVGYLIINHNGKNYKIPYYNE